MKGFLKAVGEGLLIGVVTVIIGFILSYLFT